VNAEDFQGTEELLSRIMIPPGDSQPET